jgi:hypothetical protein
MQFTHPLVSRAVMKRQIIRCACLGIPVLLLAEEVLARWTHQESDSLNKPAALGSEYYNDILSYRDPLSWEEAWEKSALSFRSSAGSFNQKEFLFRQSVRITSPEHDAWQLAYASDRVEEPRRTLDNSSLELSYGLGQDRWRLGLLGDGHSDKAFMDLGMRLSYEPAEGSMWQLIGWSVDTFYTEKKQDREDYRARDPRSWEVLLLQSWSHSSIRLRHEQDQPIVWYQVSKDQRYAYRRQASELRWTHDFSETQGVFLQIDHEVEHEAIAALTDTDNQGYRDRRSIFELGQHLRMQRESFTASIWGLWDRTQIHQITDETAFDSVWMRQEAAFLGNWSRPFWNGMHEQHWGVALNQVKLDEHKRKRVTEAKIIWSPDFALGKHGRMRLTTTWDVDQLVGDFPFTKKSFQPWGGGQASFLMVF